MSITFSVVIPAHNEENYIGKVLHSLKQQTYQNFETIVVTNGCNDKTSEIVSKRVNDRLKHLDLPVANVSRARNFGAGKASGEVLVFLDADCTLENDALAKIKEKFNENHVVASTKTMPDDLSARFKFISTFKNVYLQTGLYKGSSGALICRRKDFDSVDGYDSNITVREHRKLILKLLSNGKYTCVNTPVTTSMRRMKGWGIGKVTGYWVKQWFADKFGDLKKSEYEKIR
jgi:glycosyltransferase involved in cell wall biosynthesis